MILTKNNNLLREARNYVHDMAKRPQTRKPVAQKQRLVSFEEYAKSAHTTIEKVRELVQAGYIETNGDMLVMGLNAYSIAKSLREGTGFKKRLRPLYGSRGEKIKEIHCIKIYHAQATGLYYCRLPDATVYSFPDYTSAVAYCLSNTDFVKRSRNNVLRKGVKPTRISLHLTEHELKMMYMVVPDAPMFMQIKRKLTRHINKIAAMRDETFAQYINS
jgi:hypothetical protein